MTVTDFIRIALRHDTEMSRAMLRACGFPVGRPLGGWFPPEERADPEIEWCFANHGSPMDMPW